MSDDSLPKRTESLVSLYRWLQLPFFCGLLIALGIYIHHFALKLGYLQQTVALASKPPGALEIDILLVAFGLMELVIIINILIILIYGGYETFVFQLDVSGKAVHPEWLAHVNKGIFRIKFATALVSLSAIQLIKTLIDPERFNFQHIKWQAMILLTFAISACAVAIIDFLSRRKLFPRFRSKPLALPQFISKP